MERLGAFKEVICLTRSVGKRKKLSSQERWNPKPLGFHDAHVAWRMESEGLGSDFS